jgi:hypothetical protein
MAKDSSAPVFYMLTVTNPFQEYQKGQQITEPAEVEMILTSENKDDVVKTVII